MSTTQRTYLVTVYTRESCATLLERRIIRAESRAAVVAQLLPIYMGCSYQISELPQ